MNTLCVYCRQPLKFGPDSIGREFPCPRCGQNLRIDATGIVAPSASPEPSTAFDSLSEGDDEPIRRKRPKAAVKSRGGHGFADFLLFRAMLTPWIIQIIFWLGSLFSVGVGLMMILAAVKAGTDVRGVGSETMARGVIYGMAVIFLGPLFMRLYCEEMIIFFRIHEELCDLHTTMARKR